MIRIKETNCSFVRFGQNQVGFVEAENILREYEVSSKEHHEWCTTRSDAEIRISTSGVRTNSSIDAPSDLANDFGRMQCLPSEGIIRGIFYLLGRIIQSGYRIHRDPVLRRPGIESCLKSVPFPASFTVHLNRSFGRGFLILARACRYLEIWLAFMSIKKDELHTCSEYVSTSGARLEFGGRCSPIISAL